MKPRGGRNNLRAPSGSWHALIGATLVFTGDGTAASAADLPHPHDSPKPAALHHAHKPRYAGKLPRPCFAKLPAGSARHHARHRKRIRAQCAIKSAGIKKKRSSAGRKLSSRIGKGTARAAALPVPHFGAAAPAKRTTSNAAASKARRKHAALSATAKGIKRTLRHLPKPLYASRPQDVQPSVLAWTPWGADLIHDAQAAPPASGATSPPPSLHGPGNQDARAIPTANLPSTDAADFIASRTEGYASDDIYSRAATAMAALGALEAQDPDLIRYAGDGEPRSPSLPPQPSKSGAVADAELPALEDTPGFAAATGPASPTPRPIALDTGVLSPPPSARKPATSSAAKPAAQSAFPAKVARAAAPPGQSAERLPEPTFGKASHGLALASPLSEVPSAAPRETPATADAVRPPPRHAAPLLANPAPEQPRLAYAQTALPITLAAAISAPAANTAPPRTASRSFAETRLALPVPVFGQPAAKPKPALTASPLRANVTDQAGLGAATAVPAIREDDELILQIETAQGELADTIVAYGLRQGVYLPLSALTRFLDLPIAVSDDGHYASGWFLSEKRTLALNLRDGTLVVAGRAVPLGKGDAVAYEGELYVRAERFADLFPLDLKVDLRAQTIAVKTREPFPFDERLAREADRERLNSRAARDSGRDGAARFPREETPWRAFSLPVGETELRALTDDDLGARVEADLRLAGDVAFMTARAYASLSTRDGLTAARLELGRRDPDGDLLGPLKATEFQLGDVATGALPIGLRGVSGRGAFITNAPLEQASIFDSVDLRGDLLDGYEVELYRNNTLIGSTRSPVNGQYAFLQVPVDFGLNVFRLVFYGPQGQRREVVRKISVGDGRLAPGQFVYSVAAAQKDTNLLGVRGPRFSPAPDFGAWRSTAELGYGLSRAVTATMGAALWDNGGKHHWLAAAGLRSGIGATALRLDLGLQNGGGHTVEVGLGGKLLGLAYSLNHGEYGGGAIDEVRAFTPDPLRRATELNLNATLHFGSGTNAHIMPITSQVRRIEFADGRRQTNAALRTTLPLGGVLLSNTFDYNRVSAPTTEATSRLLGTFDLATLSGSRTRYRASIGYGLAPTVNLQSVTLEADRRIGESTLVRGGVTHTLADHQTTLGLSAIRRVGPVNVAFDGSYGFPARNFSLALRVGFSFGRNPLSGRAFLARPGLTSGGAAAVTAFADANANGVRDPGEGPVAGVTFLSGTEENRTDAAGHAFVPGLGDGARASLRVDSDSMPDIAFAPARPGIEVVPRPGRIHTTDFAIVTLSDIEGTAYFRAESGTRAVSRLQLRLLRPDGTLAARARSESDGFFLFERLPAGEYHLELDPQQAATLKIRLEAPVTLTLGGKSSVLRQSITVKSAN